ncbi:class I SAM-dependent methyltransferase [Polaromonas sp. SP1]|uniref:SAM-dependent methyltransferase n=1 Tax=Polaromonas sp. SP1 TaxID=2268087 RepID=UPI000F089847|nr:cyclopropane-fatty-acyl-phospholipid synthase family protein [Polaromonas sp. SP1]AYQ27936.1 class I SAM-dependent methyltransferase [Polaromonas sp. SP1]
MNTLNTSPAAQTFSLPGDAPSAARTALKMLLRLKHGTLTVRLPDGSLQRFGSGGAPTASLHLHNWNPCSAALRSGDIGFAESYIAGDWTTPHLTELLQVFILNRKEVEDAIYGSWLGRLAYRIKHLLNRNTKANSQKNIHAHYDLGNAFYELWLDGTMNYSSAIFATPDTTMEEAQHAKVRRALNMAQVKPGDRVLEIGCGWGALAEMATAEFGASLVGVTLSTEQLDWARQRMARLGTAPLADLRLQDYRDIGKTTPDAPFDAVCSIEMVEAVGREYWPEYFQTVHRLLKPGGHACIQSIVMADELWERYITSTDFIQQYIFPGGCLPCPREFRAQADAAGFDVVDEFAFGQDYARTLRLWREDFMAQESRVLQLGFDKRFIRIWEFYLSYCEAAFAEANTSVVQFTLRKR